MARALAWVLVLDLMPRAAAVLADRDAVAARSVARLGLDARVLVAAAGARVSDLAAAGLNRSSWAGTGAHGLEPELALRPMPCPEL